MNMMTGFSTVPLQIASLVGFAFTLFGFGVLAYVLVRISAASEAAFRGSHFWLRSSPFFGSSVVCLGNYRRVSGSHAFSDDGTS